MKTEHIIIYIVGVIIAYPLQRFAYKKYMRQSVGNYDHSWAGVVFTAFLSLWSWIMVLVTIIQYLFFILPYQLKINSKPPTWL